VIELGIILLLCTWIWLDICQSAIKADEDLPWHD
jgi:hypothetical protein